VVVIDNCSDWVCDGCRVMVTKRIYEAAAPADGYRVLVNRVIGLLTRQGMRPVLGSGRTALIGGAAAVAGLALAATWIPAWRASRTDPLIAFSAQ
jgi:hypothetical protein